MFLLMMLAGGCSECICSDVASLHLAEPLGSGGSRGPAEHLTDQPDAHRPQQSRLC